MGRSLKKCSWHYATMSVVAMSAAGLLSPSTGFSKTKILNSKDHVSGELVVKLRDAASGKRMQAAVISTLMNVLGEKGVLAIHPFETDHSLNVIRIAHDQDLGKAIAALRQQTGVLYAEPNVIYHAFDDGAPNDPDFNKTWGIKNTGQTDAAGQVGKAGADVNVVPLWQEGFHGDRKVLVAVVDTGIDWDHPDLKDNLYTNPAEAGDNSSNGVDDDKNGFIDDIHGWNFVDNTNNSRDDQGHGSHCSGTIGGVGNNGVGVAGVNWQVSLMPVKFLDSNGSGTLEAAVNAINYARMMKVNIMSNSWGGGGFNQTLKDAIQAARDAGILFAAAAGNESNNNDSSPTYPAGYDLENVIAVAATDNQDKLASFSNYGTKTVHVAAPGVKVYSTTKGSSYATLSGTSMATPHVAGISALLLSANPDWTFAQIKERLIKTSDYVPGLKKKVMAHGRVNAYNAFHGIVSPAPAEPDPSLWKDAAQAVESDHPYVNNENKTWTIHYPGAKFIRVHFEKVEVEANYDKVRVETPTGEAADEITGNQSDYISDYVSGDTVVIRLKSDESNTGFGFKVDRIQVIMGSTEQQVTDAHPRVFKKKQQPG